MENMTSSEKWTESRRAEANTRTLRLENTVLSRLTSTDTALRFYQISRRKDVAKVRGLCSAVGACFGFLSLLKVTPEWTSAIYLAGLLPEILKLALHVDVKAHRMLIREFEYILIVLSMLLFTGFMINILRDLRALVPVTMFLVVLSSQAQDASIPFEQHKFSAALYYMVGGLACIAVYILIQFGYVPDLNESTLEFSNGGSRMISLTDVQFACDRLLTASFFLFKQSFVAYFYPGCFVTLREMISKRIVMPDDASTVGDVSSKTAVVTRDPSNVV